MSINELEMQARLLATGSRLHFYLIADSAQDNRLPLMVTQSVEGAQSQCLLTLHQGPDLEAAAPHLVTFPLPAAQTEAWKRLSVYGHSFPAAVTVIASPLEFDALYDHLHSLTDVVLPDNAEMILAFWDPAILGMLLGQSDDTTLHVLGPALTEHQRSYFLKDIAGWWYWDRVGALHFIRPVNASDANSNLGAPLRLTHAQVDTLVEASVPDHLLGHIRTNKPELLRDLPLREQYAVVERHVQEARDLNLSGTRDMLNYTCAALIYRERMCEDSAIIQALEKVRTHQLSLTAALEQFP